MPSAVTCGRAAREFAPSFLRPSNARGYHGKTNANRRATRLAFLPTEPRSTVRCATLHFGQKPNSGRTDKSAFPRRPARWRCRCIRPCRAPYNGASGGRAAVLLVTSVRHRFFEKTLGECCGLIALRLRNLPTQRSATQVRPRSDFRKKEARKDVGWWQCLGLNSCFPPVET